MSDSFAAPSCTVEIFPFEGGPYAVDPGQLIEVVVEKSIRGGSNGSATIRFAPGGPSGVDSSPTWTEIITPMSHVLVGMSRGSRAAVVLDGVSIRSAEEQEWRTSEEGATTWRAPTLEVFDFAWFFNSFNWYALTFLGMTAGAVVGEALQFAPAGIPYLIDQGLLGGTEQDHFNPADVAQRWYSKVMAGQGAILGQTFVPIGGDSRVPFGQMVGTVWENYPNVIVPYGDYFMAAEQTWMAKFLDILPFPWYEFFVTTAPSGAYPLASGATGFTASGTTFAMSNQPLAPPGGPQVVARVNPIPTLSITTDASMQNSTIGALDMTRWNALLLDQPDQGIFDSRIEFDAENARNFYQLNPSAYVTYFGVNNASNIPFIFSVLGAADPSSVHRYGFRPEIGTFRWFFDAYGNAGQNPELNIPQSVATMLGKLVSWHHPQPLMARATVVLPLMPDVLIGTRFRYAPFKDPTTWDFYVEAVRHRFVFGGPSSTTLTLSRGLPTTVYDDPSADGLLQAIYTGNAMRMNGTYVKGLPSGTGSGLVTFGQPNSILTVMGELAQVFVTPQMK